MRNDHGSRDTVTPFAGWLCRYRSVEFTTDREPRDPRRSGASQRNPPGPCLFPARVVRVDFTLRVGADRATFAAAYRGSLIALRHRLTHLDIDVVSDEPWPDDVHYAVKAARQLMEQRRRLRFRTWSPRTAGVTFRTDVHDDGDFAIAVALAPYTIGGTGLGERGQVIWSGNDTGTSAVFSLTETEVIDVRSSITAGGGVADDLIPFP